MGPQQNQDKIKKSNQEEETITIKTNLEQTPPRNLTLLFHTTEGSVKVLRRCAVTIGMQVLFQRRYNHQKPPDGSQGPRSHEKEKWSHLQI